MNKAVRLSAATLDTLPAAVQRPAYDRSQIHTGIVHLGIGGFHRAHQAMYVDTLMSEGTAFDWGICGIGVLESDRHMADVLDAQNGLYTLMIKDADGSIETRVIGSIVDFIYAPDDRDAAIERMSSPDTRIVSLTITEGGYNLDAVTGAFNVENPAVQADTQPGHVPKTVFGLVVEALRRRRERGIPAFTVMSCDNIEGNGHVAQRVFVAFAEMVDPDLAAWVAAETRFPNSMVDRITPGTTPDDIALLRDRFGVDDGWPVVSEPFVQWVLEDNFALGRPAFEDVGVQVVSDVRPYELMKLRLLNASHQAIAYLGYLAGYRLVHDVASDPLFARFLLDYMVVEATPTLESVPGIDLDAYRHELIERFSNSHVRDTVARLCAESSDRIPKWLLPVIRANLDAGGEAGRAITVVAAWARYAEAVDEQGAAIEIVDRLGAELVPLAQEYPKDPMAFVRYTPVFGDLADDERFAGPYRETLESLHRIGARATLEAMVGPA